MRKRFTLRRNTLIRGLSVAIFLSLSQNVEAGTITFNTGLPVAKGQGILRGQYFLLRASNDRTSLGRSLTIQALPLVLAYGATPRAALFGIVPYMHKSLKVNTPIGRITRTTSGIGDLLFLGRYTAYALDRAGSTIRIAPFGGVKVPTGKHRDTDRLGPLPQPLQLGSGSTDVLGGLVFTWQTRAWEFDADAGYRKNTEAENFRFGDQAFADASFQYRLWPRQLGAGVPAFVYAVVESNLARQAGSRLGGIRDPNSGGTEWDVDLGLQYVTPRHVIEGIFQIPAVQRVGGTALKSDYKLSVGFRWNFSFR